MQTNCVLIEVKNELVNRFVCHVNNNNNNNNNNTDTRNVEPEIYYCTGNNWSHWKSNEKRKEKFGNCTRKTFDRSPLVEEKYQEEKACDKRHPYRIIMMMMMIIIIIITIYCNWVVTRWQRLFYMHTKYEIGY